MNVLLLGSGGREHAIAWKLAQSPMLSSLFIAPGNAGTADFGENIEIATTDFDAIRKFCVENDVKMVVVGPEDPLVLGIHDYFLSHSDIQHIPVIGPKKDGAQLEGSKDFSKDFMQRHGIPTAAYGTFTADTIQEAKQFLKTMKAPYVLKADGLAAGKGVVILNDISSAEKELDEMLLQKKFGAASGKVVIEEFLDGIECSVFMLTDGKSYKILPVAKDYKRVNDGDTGLNTGGMGAVSPVNFADKNFMEKVTNRIASITLKGLQQDGIHYTGFIFIGLMNVKGNPYVIEYNCRMGDPETEVVMPRLKNDLLELFIAVSNGTLEDEIIQEHKQAAVTVMMVSGGYPGSYDKGKKITGLNSIDNDLIFHAGTTASSEDVLSNGGRVLSVTAMGNTVKEAAAKSYETVASIHFDNCHYRKDIGNDVG